MAKGRPFSMRFDVYTDAGRAHGDMYLLLEGVSTTAAHAVSRPLEAAGWAVRMQRSESTVPGGPGYDRSG